MRVTESLQFSTVARRIGAVRSEYYRTSLQATSGLRVTAPSDDPVRVTEATRLQSSLSELEGYQRTVDLVRGDISTSENVLAEAQSVVVRAQELAMIGANGSSGPDELASLALEAEQLVGQLLSLANTKGSRGYLFGGTATSTAAFDTDGTFQGNDLEHRVAIGPGQVAVVNASGSRAFTVEGGRDAFETLTNLATDLAEGNTQGIRDSLDVLTEVHEQISRERSRTGLMLNRLDLAFDINEDASVALELQKSDLVAAVPEETYTRLIQLEQAIQESVTVGQKLLELRSLDRF